MGNTIKMNYGKGIAIDTEVKVKPNFYHKSQNFCVVNTNDSYKDASGNWQNGQSYALWVTNQDVWSMINDNSVIKIKSISSIKFTSKYSKDQAQQISNIGNSTVCNINCEVEVVQQAQPYQNNQNIKDTPFQYQDYSDVNVDVDDLELPF